MESAHPIKLGPLKDIPVGDTKVIKIDNREILLVHLESGIYALANSCAHGACRLGYGRLEGETIRCLCHGSVFNVRTGEVLNGPATTPQPTFRVVVEDGEITLVT